VHLRRCAWPRGLLWHLLRWASIHYRRRFDLQPDPSACSPWTSRIPPSFAHIRPCLEFFQNFDHHPNVSPLRRKPAWPPRRALYRRQRAASPRATTCGQGAHEKTESRLAKPYTMARATQFFEFVWTSSLMRRTSGRPFTCPRCCFIRPSSRTNLALNSPDRRGEPVEWNP